MTTKMKKWKIGALIGGLWGLLAGAFYAWGVFAAAFSHHTVIGILFENISLVWKILYLPAYLTDRILGTLTSHLVPFFPHLLGRYGGILWVLIFVLFFVGIPLFSGSIIGGGIGYLIDKFKSKK